MDYVLYRNGTLTYAGPLLSYDDTDVSMGVSYTYFVRASNAAGYRDSNQLTVTPGVTCLVPTGPVITSFGPTSYAIGIDTWDRTLTFDGSGWGSASVRILKQTDNVSDYRWLNETIREVPTSATNTRVTWTDPGTSGGTGLSRFSQTGTYYLRLYDNGTLSNVVTFKVATPRPAIHSISGSCKAGFRCALPSYDVKAIGLGYLNAPSIAGGTSTTWYINGTTVLFFGHTGSGLVGTERQFDIAGALIPTAGSYPIDACNKDVYTGEDVLCDRLYLTVDP